MDDAGGVNSLATVMRGICVQLPKTGQRIGKAQLGRHTLPVQRDLCSSRICDFPPSGRQGACAILAYRLVGSKFRCATLTLRNCQTDYNGSNRTAYCSYQAGIVER